MSRASTQHMGSVHKESPCRIPRGLTPLLTPPRAQHAALCATVSKEVGLDTPLLRPTATRRNTCRRIVAPKGVGSSPVGHPLTWVGRQRISIFCKRLRARLQVLG